MTVNTSSAAVRATIIAAVAFAATLATTLFTLYLDQRSIDRSLDIVGEVYLDVLVAAIKDAVVAERRTEVDRRIKAEFTEQAGIAERVIIIVDDKGEITNIAGNKALATAAVLQTKPGSPWIDRDTSFLMTARNVGIARAVVVLDAAPILSMYTSVSLWMLLLSLLVPALTGATAYALLRTVNADLR